MTASSRSALLLRPLAALGGLQAPGGQQGDREHHQGRADQEGGEHGLKHGRIADAVEVAQAEGNRNGPSHNPHGEHAPDDANGPGALLLGGAINHQGQVGRAGHRHRQAITGEQAAEQDNADHDRLGILGVESPGQAEGERHHQHGQSAETGCSQPDVGGAVTTRNGMAIGDLTEQDPGGGHKLLKGQGSTHQQAGKAQLAEHDAIQQAGKHHGQKAEASLKQSEPQGAGDREPGAGSIRGIHRGGGERRSDPIKGQSGQRITGSNPPDRPIARAGVRSGSGWWGQPGA